MSRQPKAADCLASIISRLLEAGFTHDGATPQQTVRVPTERSPVYGGIGGELATFGGRQRFAHPSGIKVTTGKRTIFFYRVDNGNTEPVARFDTKNVAEVEQQIEAVSKLKQE